MGYGQPGDFVNDCNRNDIRPIVYLKPTIKTNGKDSSGAWTIVDQ